MGIDILFVSYGGSHALMLKDIYSSFLDKNYKVKYLALTAAEVTLTEAKLPYDKINIFVDNEEYLYKVLNDFNIEEKKENFYMAISLSELVESVGQDEAEKLFQKYGRSIFCQKELASKILDFYKPKILITSNIIRLTRALYLSAKNRFIKTVYLEDIFMVPSHKFENEKSNLIQLSHPNIEIDYIIAFTIDAIEIIKKNLMKNNITNKANVIALGNPNIENILNKFKNSKQIKSLSFEYDLYLSNMYERDLASDLLVKFYKCNNRNLIIKTHPLEDEKYYIDKFKLLKNVQIISSKESLISLIKYSKNIFGTNTTALLEAKIINKPVYCLNLQESTLIDETFIKTKIASNITNLDELENIFKEKNSIKKHEIKIELDSITKITELLLTLLEVKV